MSTDERMEKMEGQLARIRWVNRCLIACIVLFLGVWFIEKTFGPETAWAGSSVKEIRANQLVLEDENGKIRAMLSASGPALALYDEKGKPRALLTALKEGPKMALYDEKGKIRVSLAVDKDEPRLCLFDEKGKGGFTLDVSKEGSGLKLYDEKGKPHALLGTGQTITPDGKVVSYP